MSTRKKSQSTREQITASGTFNEEKAILVQFLDDADIEVVLHGLNIQQVKKDDKKHKREKKFLEKPDLSEKPQRTSKRKKNSEDLYEGFSDESDLDERDETCEKPSGFCNENDVAGEEMYSFRTPKKSQAMLTKAKESASKSKSKVKRGRGRTPKTNINENYLTPGQKTPVGKSKKNPVSEEKASLSIKKTLITPKKTENSTKVAKTPYEFRARHKKDIQKYKMQYEVEENSSDSDYNSDEGSASDSGDESESDKENDSNSDSGKGSELSRPKCRRSLLPLPSTPSTRKRGRDTNYVVKAEEYFQSQGSKCSTSDNSLSRLRTPRLDMLDLQKLLTKQSVSKEHQHILTDMRKNDLLMFQRWMFALSQGFSVLAHGLGSKYTILQNFHKEMLPDSLVLVVNGFFPSLSIKEIVDMIAQDLLGLKQVPPTPHAVVDWIESRHNSPRVFLIIHSLDAQMLRCEKTQQLLSRLASLPRVHLVASVDHINCPLLWDQSKLGNFNFMWEDVTSFLPYQEETSYENSLMVQNSGNLVLSSLLNVYRSLPNNSRGVFRLILDKHLDNNNQKSTGMAFSELYSRCREEMLVTSDLALRTMLTEFLDHQMVKWRRDQEHLYIPTDVSILRQFHQLLQQDS